MVKGYVQNIVRRKVEPFSDCRQLSIMEMTIRLSVAQMVSASSPNNLEKIQLGKKQAVLKRISEKYGNSCEIFDHSG